MLFTDRKEEYMRLLAYLPFVYDIGYFKIRKNSPNVFGMCAGDIETEIEPAESREKVEAIRDSFLENHPEWIDDQKEGDNILLYFMVDENMYIVYQSYVNGIWIDNSSSIPVDGDNPWY